MQRLCIPRVSIALAVGASLVILAATVGRTEGQEPSQAPPKAKTDPKINAPFRKPNVRDYVKKFETEDRENYAHRDEIVAALDLKPGMAVADVGAGTGLFTRLFAEKVGPSGKVYAVDIAQPFLDHIAADARKRGQSQVVTVLGSQDETNLPAESVRPGLPERRLPPPGETREDADLDPAGAQARRPAGRDRIRSRRG